MKERPVIFNGEMVRAVLEGRKTQTRRVIKPQPKVIHALYPDASIETERIFRNGDQRIHCPCGQIGDRLWVRETWQYADWTEDGMPWIAFKAGGSNRFIDGNHIPEDWCERLSDIWADLSVDFDRKGGRACDKRWRPSIHMPRWASRILLEVTDIRVERVQEIKPEDAIREGYPFDVPTADSSQTYIDWFKNLWASINAKRGFGWDANPYVWVVEFKILEEAS